MAWGTAPDAPVYTAVSIVYAPPIDQPAADTRQASAEQKTDAETPAPVAPQTTTEQQAQAESLAPVDPQPPIDQPAAPAQQRVVDRPPPAEPQRETLAKSEPMVDEAQPRAEAVPNRVADAPAPPVPDPMPAPSLPAPSSPEPPASPALRSPPKTVEAPPAAAPHPKPMPRQVAARPQATKPSLRAGSADEQPATRSVSGAEPQSAAATPRAHPPDPSILASWNSLFSAWLAARKTYPEVARRRGEQGNVTLRFTVDGDGEVVNVALVAGSGSRILDESALALLRNAKLPRPQTEITRTVDVRYRLEE